MEDKELKCSNLPASPQEKGTRLRDTRFTVEVRWMSNIVVDTNKLSMDNFRRETWF